MQFPRHIFKKRKTVNNIEELVRLINQYNGKKDIYLSLYTFHVINNTIEYSNIDKIFFDFDSPRAFENIKQFHTYLLNHDIEHRIHFSGRGFHCFVLTIDNGVKNKKMSIANAQRSLANDAGLTIGDPKTADIDNHIIGDIARIARFPNTINPKTKEKLYCIVLPRGFDKLTLNEIKELAKTPQYPKDFIFGKNKLDLSQYDNGIVLDHPINIPKIELTQCIDIKDNFPVCIKYLLSKKNCNYQDRYYIILYLREMGYSVQQTITVLQKHLTPQKFRHCIYEEHQPQYLYNRQDLFLSKAHMHDYGVCVNCKDCPISKLYREWKDLYDEE